MLLLAATKSLSFFATAIRNFDILIASLCNLYFTNAFFFLFMRYITCCFVFEQCSLARVSNVP